MKRMLLGLLIALTIHTTAGILTQHIVTRSEKPAIIEEIASQDLRDAEKQNATGYLLAHVGAEPLP